METYTMYDEEIETYEKCDLKSANEEIKSLVLELQNTTKKFVKALKIITAQMSLEIIKLDFSSKIYEFKRSDDFLTIESCYDKKGHCELKGTLYTIEFIKTIETKVIKEIEPNDYEKDVINVLIEILEK